MMHSITSKITNVYFDEGKGNRLIDFQAGDYKYVMRFRNENQFISPVQVIHFSGTSECPFCKKPYHDLEYCSAFMYSTENKHALFHYLTSHPSVRLKLIALGLIPMIRMEQTKEEGI